MQKLADEAGQQLDELVELRRTLHQQPEVGLDLPHTAALVRGRLQELGLDVVAGQRATWLSAVVEGSLPGPTVMLRADMDALPLTERTGLPFASRTPDAMHACGHDLHTAMLVGAAKLLTSRREDLAGRVLLAFQTGEEGFHGARVMLEEGILDGHQVTAALALHVDPMAPSGFVGTRPGPVLASSDEFEIVVQGRAAPASLPFLGWDPVPVACELVQSIQTLTARRINPFTPAVVSVTGMRAGGVANAVPDEVRLTGTVRTVEDEVRSRVLAELEALVAGIASAHGGAAVMQTERGYPVTVNEPGSAARVLAIAQRLGVAAAQMPFPSLSSEDFSYVLQKTPGALAFLGARPAEADGGVTAHPLHSPHVVLDEAAMTVGSALHAAFALSALRPPQPQRRAP